MTVSQTITIYGAGSCFTTASFFWAFSVLSKRYSHTEDSSIGCFAMLLQIIALLLLMAGLSLLVVGFNA